MTLLLKIAITALIVFILSMVATHVICDIEEPDYGVPSTISIIFVLSSLLTLIGCGIAAIWLYA